MEQIMLGESKFMALKTADSIYLLASVDDPVVWNNFVAYVTTGTSSGDRVSWEFDFRNHLNSFNVRSKVGVWMNPYYLSYYSYRWSSYATQHLVNDHTKALPWNNKNEHHNDHVFWPRMKTYSHGVEIRKVIEPFLAHRKPFFMDVGCIRLLRDTTKVYAGTQAEVIDIILKSASSISMGVLAVTGDDDKDPMGGKTKYKFSTCVAFYKKFWETSWPIIKALMSSGHCPNTDYFSVYNFRRMYDVLKYEDPETTDKSKCPKPVATFALILTAMERQIASNQECIRRALSDLVATENVERKVVLLTGPAIIGAYRMMDVPSCMTHMVEGHNHLHPTETYANSPDTCALAVLCVAGSEEGIQKYTQKLGERIIKNEDPDDEIYDEHATAFVGQSTFARCMTWLDPTKDKDSQKYFDRIYLNRSLSSSGGSKAQAVLNGFAASLKAMGYQGLQGNLMGSGDVRHHITVELTMSPRSPDNHWLFPYMDTCKWGTLCDDGKSLPFMKCTSKAPRSTDPRMIELTRSNGLVLKPVIKVCPCCSQKIKDNDSAYSFHSYPAPKAPYVFLKDVCRACFGMYCPLDYQYSDGIGTHNVYALATLLEFSQNSGTYIFKGDTLRGYVRLEGVTDQVRESNVVSAIYDLKDLRKRKLMLKTACTYIAHNGRYVDKAIIDEYLKENPPSHKEEKGPTKVVLHSLTTEEEEKIARLRACVKEYLSSTTYTQYTTTTGRIV